MQNFIPDYTMVREVLTMPYKNSKGLWEVDVTHGDLFSHITLTFNTYEQALQVKSSYVFPL